MAPSTNTKKAYRDIIGEQDVVEALCKRRASNGREADPERCDFPEFEVTLSGCMMMHDAPEPCLRHELLLKAPGRPKLRERLLHREEQSRPSH